MDELKSTTLEYSRQSISQRLAEQPLPFFKSLEPLRTLRRVDSDALDALRLAQVWVVAVISHRGWSYTLDTGLGDTEFETSNIDYDANALQAQVVHKYFPLVLLYSAVDRDLTRYLKETQLFKLEELFFYLHYVILKYVEHFKDIDDTYHTPFTEVTYYEETWQEYLPMIPKHESVSAYEA